MRTGERRITARRGAGSLAGRAAVLAALAAAGCLDRQGGTDVGNGATVELDLRAYEAPAAAQPQALTLSSGATIEGVWMVVDRIRLRPGADCTEPDAEVDVEGPLVAELLGGGFQGGPASFAVPAGDFCSLRIGFHRLEGAPPPSVPPELQGRSILVRGARADGTPFTVLSELGEELELGADEGAFALPAGANPLFLAYELGPWMAALDLDALPAAPIVIRSDTDAARLDAFESAVKASARLFRDADEDGALSSEEHAPGSEIAESEESP